jgi:hypothetical protein
MSLSLLFPRGVDAAFAICAAEDDHPSVANVEMIEIKVNFTSIQVFGGAKR